MIKAQFPPTKQWEVYKFRTSPQETEGTEIMKSRPGIIISTNELNQWGKRYIFLPITSKKFHQVYFLSLLKKRQAQILSTQYSSKYFCNYFPQNKP